MRQCKALTTHPCLLWIHHLSQSFLQTTRYAEAKGGLHRESSRRHVCKPTCPRPTVFWPGVTPLLHWDHAAGEKQWMVVVAPGAHAKPQSFEPAGQLVLVGRWAEEVANLAGCHCRAVEVGRAWGCAHGCQRWRGSGSTCPGHQVHRLPWATRRSPAQESCCVCFLSFLLYFRSCSRLIHGIHVFSLLSSVVQLLFHIDWWRPGCNPALLVVCLSHFPTPRTCTLSAWPRSERPLIASLNGWVHIFAALHCVHISLVSLFQAMEMTSQKEKDWVGKESSDTIVEDLEDSHEVPLSYFEREVSLSKELLHQTSCARLLDLSPNGLDMALAAVDLKTYVCLVCKNSTHWSILEAALKAKLTKAMNDSENTRFYLSNERLGLSTESSTGGSAQPAGQTEAEGGGADTSSDDEWALTDEAAAWLLTRGSMGSLLESSPGIVSNALHFVNLGTWLSLILALLKIWWQGPSMADRSCQQKCALVAEELMAQSATNHKMKMFFGHLFHAPPQVRPRCPIYVAGEVFFADLAGSVSRRTGRDVWKIFVSKAGFLGRILRWPVTANVWRTCQ